MRSIFYKTRKLKEKKKKKKRKKIDRLAPWVADPHVGSSTTETDTPPISDICPTIVNLVFSCINENWWTLYFLSHRSPEDEWFIGKYNPLQFYLIFSFICLIFLFYQFFVNMKKKKCGFDWIYLFFFIFSPSFLLESVPLFPRLFRNQLVLQMCNLKPGQLNICCIHNL